LIEITNIIPGIRPAGPSPLSADVTAHRNTATGAPRPLAAHYSPAAALPLAGSLRPPSPPASLAVRDRSSERLAAAEFAARRSQLVAAATPEAAARIGRMFDVLARFRQGESEALLMSQIGKEV
jgi:hypothetical protein